MFNPYNDILSHLKQNLNSLILQKVTYIFVVVVQVVGDKVRMNIHISLQVQCSSHSYYHVSVSQQLLVNALI